MVVWVGPAINGEFGPIAAEGAKPPAEGCPPGALDNGSPPTGHLTSLAVLS